MLVPENLGGGATMVLSASATHCPRHDCLADWWSEALDANWQGAEWAPECTMDSTTELHQILQDQIVQCAPEMQADKLSWPRLGITCMPGLAMLIPTRLDLSKNSHQIHTWYLSFFYTHIFWGLEILHSKVRKFATKIASRQNSVIHHSVQNYTHSVKLHTMCKITHFV